MIFQSPSTQLIRFSQAREVCCCYKNVLMLHISSVILKHHQMLSVLSGNTPSSPQRGPQLGLAGVPGEEEMGADPGGLSSSHHTAGRGGSVSASCCQGGRSWDDEKDTLIYKQTSISSGNCFASGLKETLFYSFCLNYP